MKTRFNINFFKKELEYMFISGRIAGRIEFFLKDEVTEVLPFARKVFKYVYLYENQDGRTDLMYSFKKDALNSLIFHTRQVEQGDINSIRVTGEILGYPECCINAYINDRLYLTVETGINWFLRRINAENGFESEINPFNANIRHIPCSLNCTVTLKNLRLMSKIFGNTKKSDKRTAYITPLPFSYEENDEKCIRDYAEIRIISIEKDRIRYCLNGRTPPKSLSVIKDGDTLEFENGIISVMDKNRDAGRLVLSHFLWSPLTIPDRDFYRNLFETALNYSYISSLFSNSDFCSRDQRYILLYGTIKRVIGRLQFFRHIKIENPHIANNMIKIPIIFRKRRFNIILQYRSDTRGYFIKGKNISLCIEGEHQTISEDLRRFLSLLLSVTDREM